jgi:ABC-2 type transport system permease protein
MMILLPFVFLSGFIFPIGGMPDIFRWITWLVPANYAVQIVRGIVMRGATVAQLWQPILLLSLYTIAIVGLAVMRFKKTAA